MVYDCRKMLVLWSFILARRRKEITTSVTSHFTRVQIREVKRRFSLWYPVSVSFTMWILDWSKFLVIIKFRNRHWLLIDLRPHIGAFHTLAHLVFFANSTWKSVMSILRDGLKDRFFWVILFQIYILKKCARIFVKQWQVLETIRDITDLLVWIRTEKQMICMIPATSKSMGTTHQ